MASHPAGPSSSSSFLWEIQIFCFFFGPALCCLVPVIYFLEFFFAISFFHSFSVLISVLEECLISSGSFIMCGIYKHFLCLLTPPLCCLPVGLRCFSPELPQPVAYLWRRSCHCSTAICVCNNSTRMLRLWTNIRCRRFPFFRTSFLSMTFWVTGTDWASSFVPVFLSEMTKTYQCFVRWLVEKYEGRNCYRTFPCGCGCGSVASLFFSVSLEFVSQGNIRRRSLQGPRSAATGWLTNTALSSVFFFVYLFVAVHFRITSWCIITHYQVYPLHFQ